MCARRFKTVEAVLLLHLAALGVSRAAPLHAQGLAQEPAARQAATNAVPGDELQLEVFTNGVTTGVIGTFRRETDGTLKIQPKELRELGIYPQDAALDSDGWIVLNRLSGVSSAYDEISQTVQVTTTDSYRIPRQLDARQAPGRERQEPERGTGAFVNYTLFANLQNEEVFSLPSFDGVSGTFEGVAYSPYGNFSQSLITKSSSSVFDTPDVIRLNSSWSYFDSHNLASYTAGDLISGGLLWTRPVRLGGLQVRRNFSLRPDLVTMPVPTLSGSAAVPSTVEVYANGSQSYQTSIPGGPFQISNLPIVTGPGTVRLVVRDASGREIVEDVPFYASSQLLAPGLFDFSLETGFARNYYGIYSDAYDDRMVGSGTMRVGITDTFTLEGHGEGGAGLMNGGLGAVFNLGSWGVASAAAATSLFEGQTGFQLAGSVEVALGAWRLYMRSQHTFGDYQDIASVTANPSRLPLELINASTFNVLPPKAIDQISLSVPLLDKSVLSLNFANFDQGNYGTHYKVASMSYSRPVLAGTFFTSGFVDFSNSNNYGFFVGYSMPIGAQTTASLSASATNTGPRIFAEASRSEGTTPGSYGWRIIDAEGAQPYRGVGASYRGESARVEASVQQYQNNNAVTATMQGAVVIADNSVFFTNQISDSFAVVDVGVPGVTVSNQNRYAGTTGPNGKILVADIQSYLETTIDIDPLNLPVDADVPETRKKVVPAARTGVVIKFDAKSHAGAALVSFVNGAGTPLPVGTSVDMEGANDTAVIGYEGTAFLRNLSAHNIVDLTMPDGTACRAAFEFAARPGEQVHLEGVVCR